jgi:hypothetical protein
MGQRVSICHVFIGRPKAFGDFGHSCEQRMALTVWYPPFPATARRDSREPPGAFWVCRLLPPSGPVAKRILRASLSHWSGHEWRHEQRCADRWGVTRVMRQRGRMTGMKGEAITAEAATTSMRAPARALNRDRRQSSVAEFLFCVSPIESQASSDGLSLGASSIGPPSTRTRVRASQTSCRRCSRFCVSDPAPINVGRNWIQNVWGAPSPFNSLKSFLGSAKPNHTLPSPK